MSSSLYLDCVKLTDELKDVPGFEELLEESIPSKERPDPVTLLWTCFRLGTALCYLINFLRPSTILTIHDTKSSRAGLNQAKTNVYNFLAACRAKLLMKDEDLFSLSDLYKDDTNCFVSVLKTIKLVVEIAKKEGRILGKSSSEDGNSRSSLDAKTIREQCIREILETERKYVQDLEFLQNFSRVLVERNIINRDNLVKIFSNLDVLLDFQRKFLIGLEDICSTGFDKDKKLGALFSHNEESFSVYGAFCANYKTATEKIMEMSESLNAFHSTKHESSIEPVHDLPSYLIKPIQRICKYPLFLKELSRLTPNDKSLLEAYESISRVAAMINEARRREENKNTVDFLNSRIDDWKGYNLKNFGELLYDANLLMIRREVEKEVHIFFFERIIICCKEIKKERKKSISFSRKSNSSNRSSNNKTSNPDVMFQLKGGVPIGDIEGVVASFRHNTYQLKVFYKDYQSDELESFILVFLNEEPLRIWNTQLERLLEASRRLQQERERRVQRQTASAGVENNPRDFDNSFSRRITTNNLDIQIPLQGASSQKYSALTPLIAMAPALHSPRKESVGSNISDYGFHSQRALKPSNSEENHNPQSNIQENTNVDVDTAIDEILEEFMKPTDLSNTIDPRSPVKKVLGTEIRKNSVGPSIEMKLKIHFNEEIFICMAKSEPVISFSELVKLILNRICNEVERVDMEKKLRIRYKDEDGDFITIRDNDDVKVAVRLVQVTSGKKAIVLNLYVAL